MIITNDLTWRDQVDKTVKSCNSKQSGLWKCTSLLRQDQRKAKAEGVILSRIGYCLEVVSQGRKTDLERLQSVQSKAARWVLQVRKQDWSLRGGLRKLEWLSMAQQAVYNSIKLAMKVIKDCQPERLYNILTEDKEGVHKLRIVKEKVFKKMKATTRKSWSNRSLRWLEQMPCSLKQKDISLKSTKRDLKAWVKHHIPVRGDRILWGKPLSGDMKRKKKINQETDGGDDQEGPQSPESVNDIHEAEEDSLEYTEEASHTVTGVQQWKSNEKSAGEEGRGNITVLKFRWWKLWLMAILITSDIQTRIELKDCNRRNTVGSRMRKDKERQQEVSSGWCYLKTERKTGVG